MSDSKNTKKDDDAVVIDEKGQPEDPQAAKEPKSEKAIKISGDSRWKRFLGWYKSNKKKSVPLTILVLVGVLALIPWSRYQAAALVVSNSYRVEVVDAATGTAVSGADVYIGDSLANTDGSGIATLHGVPAKRDSQL
jgi:hypothetical protein